MLSFLSPKFLQSIWNSHYHTAYIRSLRNLAYKPTSVYWNQTIISVCELSSYVFHPFLDYCNTLYDAERAAVIGRVRLFGCTDRDVLFYSFCGFRFDFYRLSCGRPSRTHYGFCLSARLPVLYGRLTGKLNDRKIQLVWKFPFIHSFIHLFIRSFIYSLKV